MSTNLLSGYRLPAEWEPHKATWLSWPYHKNTWTSEELPSVLTAYTEFVAIISQGEEVHINVNDQAMQDKAIYYLEKHDVKWQNIHFHFFPTNDAWCRDHGPDFMIHDQKEKIILDWQYNSWGGKYPPYDLDNAIPRKIADFSQLTRIRIDMVLEGGSIDTNGQGTLITTKSCLLHPNRNPQLTQTDIEELLKKYYNIQQIIWLEEGIVGDDTDGHVDDITRFVSPNTVVSIVETNPFSPNHSLLQRNLEILRQTQLLNGEPLQVIELPMPKEKLYHKEHLPCSYANFYICNEAVIVPIFDDINDEAALRAIQSAFPNKKIRGVYSGDIIIGLGSFHCLSKHEPL